jgi:hypothetical protein
LPNSAATGGQLVLEKCAHLKQAWGYRPFFRAPMNYQRMPYQGGYYPQQHYGFPRQGCGYPQQGFYPQQQEEASQEQYQRPDLLRDEEEDPSFDRAHQQHQFDLKRLARYALANNLSPERYQQIKSKYEQQWQQKQKLRGGVGASGEVAQGNRARS